MIKWLKDILYGYIYTNTVNFMKAYGKLFRYLKKHLQIVIKLVKQEKNSLCLYLLYFFVGN